MPWDLVCGKAGAVQCGSFPKFEKHEKVPLFPLSRICDENNPKNNHNSSHRHRTHYYCIHNQCLVQVFFSSDKVQISGREPGAMVLNILYVSSKCVHLQDRIFCGMQNKFSWIKNEPSAGRNPGTVRIRSSRGSAPGQCQF